MSGDPQAEAVLVAVTRVCSVHAWFLRHGDRRPWLMQCRATAALAMRAQGLGWRRIARALNRSPSSVVELVERYAEHQPTRELVGRVSETQGFVLRESRTG